jgi:hypothetical protein
VATKRFPLLVILIICAISTASTFADASKHFWVTVKETQVRAEPSYLGKVLAVLYYGNEVNSAEQLETTGTWWIKVRLPEYDIEGWVNQSALIDKNLTDRQAQRSKDDNKKDNKVHKLFLKPQPAEESEIANYMLEYIRDFDLNGMIKGARDGIFTPSIIPDEMIIVCFPVKNKLGNDEEISWGDWADHMNPKRVWIWAEGSISESVSNPQVIESYVHNYISPNQDRDYHVAWGLFQFGIESVSADLTDARVYYEASCGPLFAWGTLLSLHREPNAKWKVVSSFTLFRS